jgi:hypothetical protein
MPSEGVGIAITGMERQAHTQIYTSTLSRRERAWRGRRRHWARLIASAATVAVAVAVALTGVAGHVI